MNDQVVEKPSHWTRTIDSALLIAILTATSYGAAFSFQVGYLSYFSVPEIFAEVSINRVFIAAGVLMFSLLIVFQIVDIILKMLPSSIRTWHPIVQRTLLLLLAWLAFAVIVANYLDMSKLSWVLWVGIPVVFLAGELLMPLVLYPRSGSYSAKLEASVPSGISNRGFPGVDLVRGLIIVVTPTVAVLLVVAIILAFFAYAAGVHEARLQKQFLVLDGDSQCAVVDLLSEGLLCVEFDGQTHTMRAEYRFVAPSGAKLGLRTIGPLKQTDLQR